jgi:UDP-N-acetylglucosamine 4,6-dehydratase
MDPVFETGLYSEPNIDLTGKSVFITGGTGCLGSSLVRAICDRYEPKQLVVYSRDEAKQFEMSQRLRPADHPYLRYVLGDIRDVERLTDAMEGIDIVIHTAALKHVTISEQNPVECLQTNATGTANVVRAARRNRVSTVQVVSTDKAVQPINMYGASKLAAEKIATSRPFGIDSDPTRVHVVRFGNFAGSRGSVIPIFDELIRSGATTLPVTDERMTRFWITIKEAVNFSLSSLGIAVGGEVMVPRMRAMSVVELAEVMAPTLKVEFTGLRDGEKLHEILISHDAASNVLDYQDRYIILRANRPESREHFVSLGAKAQGERFSLSSEDCQISRPEAAAIIKHPSSAPSRIGVAAG